MSNVLISEELLIDLYRAHVFGIVDPDADARIRKGLEVKMEAVIRRRLYSDMKTADTPQAYEKARQAYLERLGLDGIK